MKCKLVHMFSSVLVWFFPLVLSAQHFYYGNGKQIPLEKAGDILVLQLEDTLTSAVRVRAQQVFAVEVVRPLRPQRGIFQFNLSSASGIDEALAAFRSSFKCSSDDSGILPD